MIGDLGAASGNNTGNKEAPPLPGPSTPSPLRRCSAQLGRFLKIDFFEKVDRLTFSKNEQRRQKMTEGRRSGRAEIRTERKEERENMKKRWITQSEYASRYGISRQAVSKAVKVGRLKRVDGKVDGNIDITTDQAKGKQDNELVTLRKEKLEIEKELAEMKLERAREEIRKEAIAEFVSALHRKYEHVRKGLADLSLSPVQVEKLERLLIEYDEGLADIQQT